MVNGIKKAGRLSGLFVFKLWVAVRLLADPNYCTSRNRRIRIRRLRAHAGHPGVARNQRRRV